jgi:hypothetical protein
MKVLIETEKIKERNVAMQRSVIWSNLSQGKIEKQISTQSVKNLIRLRFQHVESMLVFAFVFLSVFCCLSMFLFITKSYLNPKVTTMAQQKIQRSRECCRDSGQPDLCHLHLIPLRFNPTKKGLIWVKYDFQVSKNLLFLL